jgi:hypothetical protein
MCNPIGGADTGSKVGVDVIRSVRLAGVRLDVGVVANVNVGALVAVGKGVMVGAGMNSGVQAARVRASNKIKNCLGFMKTLWRCSEDWFCRRMHRV